MNILKVQKKLIVYYGKCQMIAQIMKEKIQERILSIINLQQILVKNLEVYHGKVLENTMTINIQWMIFGHLQKYAYNWMKLLEKKMLEMSY